jgi:hypothetical protein
MPNRILRDWTDSYLFRDLSCEAESLFARLIMKADDFGNFHGAGGAIGAICFPLGVKINVQECVEELSRAGVITLYEVNGRKYLHINNFGQRLRNHTRKFPEPPNGTEKNTMTAPCQRIDNQMTAPCQPNDRALSTLEKRIEEKRIEENTIPPKSGRDIAGEFERFWEAYPDHRKTKKVSTQREWSMASFRLPPIEVILQALENHKASEEWQKEEGKFVTSPLNWISEQSWNERKQPGKKKPSTGQIKPAMPIPEVDDDAALAWLRESYDLIEQIPVEQYSKPFNQWPKMAQRAYIETLPKK